jgi:hypothetical protein
VKLDVEGAEDRVLSGARRTLRDSRPRVIFESWTGPSRARVAEEFERAGYRICALPWDATGEPRTLDARAFHEGDATNYLAEPL